MGSVGKYLGFETGEAAKNIFTSLRTKYVKRKKILKDPKKIVTDAKRVMKAKKGMQDYGFLSWLEYFVYERNNKCNLQNNGDDIRFLRFRLRLGLGFLFKFAHKFKSLIDIMLQ